MYGVNKVMLLGNLGADPEVKKTTSQQTLANFNLATSDSWVNKEGERQDRTEWHRIVVFGKLAEHCARYLTKGQKVFIEGRLQTRSWETEQGQKRFTTEVVAKEVCFLGKSQQNREDSMSTESNNMNYKKEPGFNPATEKKEELPF